jgi:hypothetical protein
MASVDNRHLDANHSFLLRYSMRLSVPGSIRLMFS